LGYIRKNVEASKMKKFLTVCTALLVTSALTTWAGAACCAAGGKAKADKSYSACTRALSGIELTAEQKAKIDEIEAACKAEGMTVEACAKSMDQIRQVLNDEQRAKFDAQLGKIDHSTKGCG
jgi:Spy/CpxP family protein refolding chaperone